MKHFIFIASLFCTFTCAHSTLFAQKVLKDTKISFGWSNFDQDRRFATFEMLRDKVEPDLQRAILIEHYWRGNKRFNISTGLGYARTTSYFSRDYSQEYLLRVPKGASFAGVNITFDTYKKHTIQIPVRVQYEPLRFKSLGLYAHLTAMPSLAFYKSIDPKVSTNLPKGRTMFTLDNIEINPGIGLRFWRFDLSWSYRYKNFSKKDEMVFGPGGASYDPNRDDKYEWYNIRKMWWTLGYRF